MNLKIKRYILGIIIILSFLILINMKYQEEIFFETNLVKVNFNQEWSELLNKSNIENTNNILLTDISTNGLAIRFSKNKLINLSMEFGILQENGVLDRYYLKVQENGKTELIKLSKIENFVNKDSYIKVNELMNVLSELNLLKLIDYTESESDKYTIEYSTVLPSKKVINTSRNKTTKYLIKEDKEIRLLEDKEQTYFLRDKTLLLSLNPIAKEESYIYYLAPKINIICSFK